MEQNYRGKCEQHFLKHSKHITLVQKMFPKLSFGKENGARAAELSCLGTGNITSTLIPCQLEKFNLLEFYRIERVSQHHSPCKVQYMSTCRICSISPSVHWFHLQIHLHSYKIEISITLLNFFLILFSIV